ncbi:protein bric-a-brac 1 isoform X3 [Folsomia candida]|uniref:protein bric-a-brac 1 isoform X3 n=1 Tax=Folsomia candida TaxID=158441 RepID=UPI0016054644|nr:protein bric-a-brac 1 isoform X3 [Folsomia candida]
MMGSTDQQHQPQQQYCLRWNNWKNNLTNVFDQLLQAEAFVDVTLSAEGHSLKAHKVVLCACSPYFQALFFDNPCKHPIVILGPGVKWMQLKALTEFMYRGEINVAHDQLAPLLKVAELLKIRGLADVSHSRNTALTNTSQGQGNGGSEGTTPLTTLGDSHDKRPNPADFLSNSNHSHSGSESISLNGHGRRKRRKMSTPERTPSPGGGGGDGAGGDDNSLSGQEDGDRDLEDNDRDLAISMSVNPILSATPTAADLQRVLGSNQCGSALLNLHAAAAAAAAVAGSGGGSNNGSSSGGGGGGPSPSTTGDMDIKPGIVEMIREEERAKMLESAHGWLGPGSSTLSESYQYQIQNLWQKCWNQNQGGMMHALRFRERGPLKSWRPETMSQAIFAVLREGLSLSQAARKFDIPYPTFVLYANRVHNMLGPSVDGSSSSGELKNLMSDIRPKGRGRPQRILLGTWEEGHIRAVIRAVVFRDTQTKDDIPTSFVFNRDGTLCLPQSNSSTPATAPRTPTPSACNTPTPNSNGVDMSLHPHFAFSSPASSAPPPATTSITTDGHSSSSAPQHHHQQQSRHNSSSSSSNSSSPLQAALTSATAAAANFNLNLQAAAQSQLLAFQQAQTHFQKVQQQLQHSQGRRGSISSNNSDTSINILGGKQKSSSSSSISNFQLANLAGFLTPGMKGFEGMKDIFQIKTELGAYDDNNDEDGVGAGNSEENDLDLKGLQSANGSVTIQQSVATDLSRNSPENVNNNEKDGLFGEEDDEDDDEDGGDLGPVAVVQIQMDPGAKSVASPTSGSVIVGTPASSSGGVDQTSSPPR